jgi:hypothetical protein
MYRMFYTSYVDSNTNVDTLIISRLLHPYLEIKLGFSDFSELWHPSAIDRRSMLLPCLKSSLPLCFFCILVSSTIFYVLSRV